MSDYEDRFWTSRDGVKLHFRDYAGPDAPEGPPRLPVVCLPGLTRNARDFELLAPHMARSRRVLCPEMRGRGDSEYAKDSASYNPVQYGEDLLVLLEQEGIDRFVAVGTSLGGMMTMGLALSIPDRIAAAVLNDVGPVLEPDGLRRILDYVGQGRNFATWVHAARAIEGTQGDAHPGQPLDFWIGRAKRLMTLGSNGRIVFDYDMKIAEPLATMDVENQPELWPAWEALAGRPLLVVRGALSDLFSAQTLKEMLVRVPEAEAVTLSDVGHAPTLDEPEAVAAIDRLLDRAD
ncbi:alpha/beta fold hydrolase [Novosphingobium pentaromativorans]|uniref:Alpha/beta hydrolase n=1 Tax=Novosphingobium pentaromativorans US6-1 TaxID=1088721 RepID=G6ECT7_9SPHN|nr:alpha/beta hydrolase [Novosphingobium pentaromativorans]AIT79957.1 alpha/beta hydrolase [Novosphingobium pentaromativorans US6-1]EHJ60998.1 alpha/beta hydrolase [Novosphingobium pentaromativorans US6-1]